ncbi:EamA family transporter RarD [Dendrosporobacter sp. 1207_IL3150]|uniref:EamA family transporter RarD n=1 Tax=Dendrosporobacter sp. 1207_IL3150 TaxID=3084054 RepID=UPI002FD8C11D
MGQIKSSKNMAGGIFSALGAYVIWGILPIYWKLVSEVPAHEVLAHRIFWSFVFMACIILALNKGNDFIAEFRDLLAKKKKLAWVVLGAVLISLNWFIYIWAVNDNRVIETSLGYYINPLFNVIIGIVVLHERLSFWQLISVCLAALGVVNMALNLGSLPWVALVLAISFGIYGLCKKKAGLAAITSITLETLIIAPFAGIYLAYIHYQGNGFPLTISVTTGYLIGTGIVTAVPLLLFSSSANKLPLSLLGFIQYVSPSIGLLLGIFLYHEAFTLIHMVSFGFIWLALLVFSLAKTTLFTSIEAAIVKKWYIEQHKAQ